MKIKGDFIEDMEQLQELYNSRFVHYSTNFHYRGGNYRDEQKMIKYGLCVQKMEKFMKFINSL